MHTNDATPAAIKVVDNGPQRNRMDVVMMGDGYTSAERDRFVADVGHMSAELLNSTTFWSIYPLLNVWAVFVPSRESGVGTNDDYYGGLGGEFVISTRSPSSGVVVLRHEMSHNFVQVGEEYNDGVAYFGANTAATLAEAKKKWAPWLNDTQTMRAEKDAVRISAHPWHVLTKEHPTYTRHFTSDGTLKRWMLELSVSGFDQDDDIEVAIDHRPLEWRSRRMLDRSFYRWLSPSAGFHKGQHTFTVRLKQTRSVPVPQQVCSVNLLEYAGEDAFRFTLWPDTNTSSLFVVGQAELPQLGGEQYFSAYPTYDINGHVTYRPTNEFCLMRNVHSNELCSVCLESLWLHFLARMTLIDSLTVTPTPNATGRFDIQLALVPLAHHRSHSPHSFPGEEYAIRWYCGTVEVKAWRNLEAIAGYAVPAAHLDDEFTVSVQFKTPHIRHDPHNLTFTERSFRFSQAPLLLLS
ncbi:hypothetical protein RI367_006391 [Sorochytrium milnesiophthora]